MLVRGDFSFIKTVRKLEGGVGVLDRTARAKMNVPAPFVRRSVRVSFRNIALPLPNGHLTDG